MENIEHRLVKKFGSLPMSKPIVGIDIGTYHVKVVIAEPSDNPMQPPRILGTGYAESRGLKNGYSVSIGDVSRSVAAALNQASKSGTY